MHLYLSKCVNVYYLSVIISGLVFKEKFLVWVCTRLQIFHTYVMNNTYIRKPKVYKTFFWNFCSNTNPEIGRSDRYTVLYIHLIQWCTNKSSTLIILFVYLVCIPFPIHRLSHYLLMKYIQIHIVDFRNVRRSVYRRDLPFW